MTIHQLHTEHQRRFEANRFVYPVLSRRSGGLSLGVNLNPDKVCNFDCIYCQVDRSVQGESRFVETPALLAELRDMLQLTASGEIYQTEKFRNTPAAWRRLNDMAFSGDGEPTTYRNFDEIIAACAQLKREAGLGEVKMVLITNASMFHRPHVQRGLQLLDANQGEIWAKLDAGTAEYFKLVDRTPIAFAQILENITQAAQVRPLVIQSLFMRVNQEPPSTAELEAYCDRLNEVVAQGGRLSLVQVYTIARRPAESYVASLSDAEVDAIVERVQRRTGLVAAPFYGA
ncbi:radical SAM protein [Lignipirellula cremea]|uniref:Cyclic pyranopterin monophosphate synthase n=1 Tax=Lignipirellula cremea TaxID=2528010 RepID=A0A518E2C7_9BACT|nr:radical SAM protein [Lignipirellula cremea]QDU98248.1 Cyclic pyranopterin monophosphate synthase [Lignipirellula cremea]